MNGSRTFAVFGLGSMGYGMAVSILRAGHEVHGFDINPDAVLRLRAEGGAVGEVADVAGKLDGVVVVVLNAAQSEAVLFGEAGIVPRLRRGAVVMACATVPPDFARDMEARCLEHGVHYLDAPISGGSVKAAEGALSIMASGTAEAFLAARPVLDATASRVFEVGVSAGAGSALKAINQLLAGVHIAAMAEALTFGMTLGVKPDTFIDVISQCAGTSWMLENRAPHVVNGDYSPRSSIDIWPKDLGIVLEMAEESDFPVPIAAAALSRFRKAVELGLGREDDAAVAKVYAREVGLSLPEGNT